METHRTRLATAFAMALAAMRGGAAVRWRLRLVAAALAPAQMALAALPARALASTMAPALLAATAKGK